ncbi:MAG: aminotransferase class I/II-fold pyridoxal phosphate-dependent enzyme [Mogibacterium sp.]|nr:aminotransferase class I/II-fold pyridoxal phosphate-dependent enzyme [Mogibacterium sp.]
MPCSNVHYLDINMKNHGHTELNSRIVHGGDIYRNRVELDYSVNLNPEPAPEEIMTAALKGLELMHNYPDPLQEELRTAIVGMAGCRPSDVVCGCGASELMMAIVHAVRPGSALITAPCYAGYEYALGACDAKITEYMLSSDNGFALGRDFADLITESTDIVFLANPNNPNGRLIEDDVLEAVKEKCRQTGTVLVIDECFLQLTDRYDDKPDITDGAIHLRAFTKTFAIPGIRLGYLICGDHELTENIRKHLPEWNISAIAEQIGIAAAKVIKDTGYLAKSVASVRAERAYLEERLTALGIKVYPSDTNYLLLEADAGLAGRLMERGIMVRRCSNYHGLDERYIRIAVRRHEDNERLLRALEEIIL